MYLFVCTSLYKCKRVLVSVYVFNSAGYIFSGRIAGSHGSSTLTFSTAAKPFYIPTNNVQSSNFFTSLPTHYFFIIIAILVGVMWYLIVVLTEQYIIKLILLKPTFNNKIRGDMMKAPEVSRTHSHHILIVVGDQSQAFIKFTRTKFRSRILFYQGWSTIWAATN